MIEAAGSGFALVPVAIGAYEHPDFGEQALGVCAEVRKLHELLKPYGARLVPWDVAMEDRTANATRDRLRGWSDAGGDNTVLYWVGHGYQAHKKPLLACGDSRATYSDSGVSATHLAEYIEARQAQVAAPPWCIAVVDACRAGPFVDAVNGALMEGAASNVLLIGTAGDAATHLGSLNRSLQLALGVVFGANREIGFYRLMEALSDPRTAYRPAVHAVRVVKGSRLVRRQPLEFATSLAMRPGLEEALSEMTAADHDSLTAHVDLGEMAWHFVGRDEETRRVARWVNQGTSRMLTVTGKPGTGKSAFLGQVMVYSWPRVREALIERNCIDARGPEDRPRDDAFRTSLRMTGATTASAVRRLGSALEWECPDDATQAQRMRALREASAKARAILIVDGVDEALQPLGVAQVLRAVAEAGSRLLVGTRRSTSDTPDDPAPETERNILQALGAAAEDLVTLERDHDALTAFVATKFDYADEGLDKGRLGRVRAEVVAALKKANAEFLLASLVLHELVAEPTLLDRERKDELAELLRENHEGVFRRAVARLAAASPRNAAVLEALAYSLGRGMPVEHDVLGRAAAALAGEPEGVIDQEAIAEVFRAARWYVLSETEHDQTVYRLAHQTFRKPFLEAADEALPARHAAIAQALISSGRHRQSPYVRHYLSGHTCLSGDRAWAELAAATETLDALDVHALTADAQRIGFGRLPRDVVATISVQDLIDDSPEEHRAGLRQLGAARLTTSADETVGSPGSQGWSVRWARMRRQPPHVVAMRGARGVSALTVSDTTEPVIAAAFSDGSIRLWDAAHGAPLGPPIDLGGQVACALAIVQADGDDEPKLIAGVHKRVCMWGLLTGVEHPPLELDEPITALTAHAIDDGRVLVATGSSSGAIGLRFADAGPVWSPDAEPPPATGEIMHALAFTELGGALRLLAAGRDEHVRAYGVSSEGTLVLQRERQLLSGWIQALATCALGGELHVVAGGADARRRLADWNADADRRRPLSARAHVRDVVICDTTTGPQIVAGGVDGSLLVWDAATLEASPTVDAHPGCVRALATYTLEGTPRIVSGGEDGSVRVWEPSHQVIAGPDGASARIRHIATWRGRDGQYVIVTADVDGGLAAWDACSGRPAHDVGLPPEGSDVSGLYTLSNGALAIAYGSGALVVCEPGSSSSPRSLRLDQRVHGAALAHHAGRDVLVASTSRGAVRGWDLTTGEEIPALRPAVGSKAVGVRELVPTSHGVYLVGVGPVPVPVPTDEVTPPPLAGGYDFLTAACSVDGWLVAGDQSGGVFAWQPGRDADAVKLGNHRRAVNAAAALASPSLVVTGGEDGTVRVWRLDTEEAEVEVLHLGTPVHDVVGLPGGAIALATEDGVLVIELEVPAAQGAG